ncbi:hypothetical protein [Rhodopirellula sallentina]|uniref:Uncharacterized protein n=1 Tax=Rhodopirellula sallentina SM41 TaxID=1263870 RepID=M5UGX8_9BACT|nr:hypothetical protein [Rhodopirellula sallentina]EMI55263.1 hypothetical protein RSSM_03297 [Rhodopirellula sallentina SM41]
MIRVDPILFSNVSTAIQRTANLTGGAVRGLPNGIVIEGLKGINSFNSEMAEAQKEFNQGRVQSSLQRVRQMEMTFNGIAGRWNSTVGSIVTSARQGKNNLSIQKLNEVKNAQAKMQQLTGPVTKTFRDLITALDHAVSNEDDKSDAQHTIDSPPQSDAPASNETESESADRQVRVDGATAHREETPDPNLLERFAEKYQYGPRLRVEAGADGKARVRPKIESGQFYFMQGIDPPAVVRVRDVQRQSVIVFDSRRSLEVAIDSGELKRLLREGIWLLQPR